MTRIGFLTAFAVAGIAFAPTLSFAGCPASDHINGSTAQQAMHQMEQAGYSHVRDLKKGCDNFWHAAADRNGSATGVALSPQGQILAEDDSYQGNLTKSASSQQ